MPGFPSLPPLPGGVPRSDSAFIVGRFVDRRGLRRTSRIRLYDKTDLTLADAETLMGLMGNCSNAGLYEVEVVLRRSIPISRAITFDEANPSVGQLGVIKLQDVNNTVVRVEIPAIDDVCLDTQRKYIKEDELNMAAFIASLLNYENERGLNDLTFIPVATSFVERSLRGASLRIIPEIFREPGELDTPPDEPGLDEGI